MEPGSVMKTYRRCARKKRPWKNINKILSKIQDEENKPVTAFDALSLKNIGKQKLGKGKVKKKLTSQVKVYKRIEEKSLESTFDRILAGPIFQDLCPPQATGSSEYVNSESLSTSSLGSVSRVDIPSEKSSTLSRKYKCSPTYPVGKCQLRFRKKLKLHRERKREKIENHCLTSTPNGSEQKDDEGKLVLSPILQNRTCKINSRSKVDKENISVDMKFRGFSSNSYAERSCGDKNSTRKSLGPLLLVNKSNHRNCENSECVINNDNDKHPFENLKAAIHDKIQYSETYEHSPKDVLQNSSCVDIFKLTDSLINDELLVDNPAMCVDSEIQEKHLESKLDKLSKSVEKSVIMFDAWDSAADSKEILKDLSKDLENLGLEDETSLQRTTDYSHPDDIKPNSNVKIEESSEDDIPLAYLKNKYLISQTEGSAKKDNNSDSCFRRYRSKITVQNIKSYKRLSRRFSHQVVLQQTNTGEHNNFPTFCDVYRPSSRKISESLHEEDVEEISSVIEEKESDLDQTDCTSISVDTVCTFTAKDAVLQRCCQSSPVPFCDAFASGYWKTCRKIGEGVYGEVFMSDGDDRSVLKIIPIEGEQLVNGEPQKKFAEILSEIVITMELSNLRYGVVHRTQCFAEMKRCLCVQGKYPEELIQLWNDYNDRKGSENDSPLMFTEDQLYIILEMANGGRDLESYMFTSAEQTFSIIVQTAFALAVAEQALEFEHRDLHWGNLLIARTSEKELMFRLCGEEYTVATNGVQVAVIDFTLSRMSYDGCCIFNDLSRDPALFTAEGDYQFEIYRLMQKHTMDVWDTFVPYTNVLWLHYLTDKMCTMVNYQQKKSESHKKGIQRLTHLQSIILKYESAGHLVLSSNMSVT